MNRFISLSSGSNGNCYYIGSDKAGILIDLGIGTRTIKKRLRDKGIDIESVQAVFVSHDHFDHIRSLGTFTERYHRPVYATGEVISSFERHFCTKGYMCGNCRRLEPGRECSLDLHDGDSQLKIIPFRVPHDATDTVGYHIDFDGTKLTFITDIGNITEDAIYYSSMAEHLIIEANYDVDMLVRGPYPQELKLRIMNGTGHLSNEQTARLISTVTHKDGCRLKDVFLCHLSENNNTPDSAFRTIKKAMPESIALYCLPRKEASREFII